MKTRLVKITVTDENGTLLDSEIAELQDGQDQLAFRPKRFSDGLRSDEKTLELGS